MALATNYNNTTFSSGDLVTHDKLNTVKVVQTGDTSANNIIGSAGQLTFDTTTKQLRVHDGSVAGGHILGGSGGAVVADGAVTFAKMQDIANLKVIGNVSGSSADPAEVTINDTDNMSDASATTLATSESIKAYVDAETAGGGFTPTSYAGEESVTFPNGVIMKWGSVSCSASSTTTVTFGAAFNTIQNVQITEQYATNDAATNTVRLRNAITNASFTIRNNIADTVTVYWQAMGR